MTERAIDLRSDTLTLPTEEMLRSMATARLGDDSRDGDPTVVELEHLAASMLGKEAALLTVSGTMSNLVALRTHAEPGACAIVEETAHLYGMELGGIAAAASLLVLPVPGFRGAMNLDGLRVALRKAAAGFPARGVVCLEDTHNGAGGTIVAADHLARCAELAHGHGVPVHLDGARIFNAAVALAVDVKELTRHVDSVSMCLSKGLSAPVGSLLAGPAAFIDRARKVRRALGGTMRQAGVLAAPGIVALQTMIPRLIEDHRHARILARRVAEIPGLRVDLDGVQTNIVNVDVRDLAIDGATFVKHMEAAGVRGLANFGTGVRLVTYRGITEEHVLAAARTLEVLIEA
ncbi:MAG: threonine aldolase family protein, partial [Bacteroidales bacterium]